MAERTKKIAGQNARDDQSARVVILDYCHILESANSGAEAHGRYQSVSTDLPVHISSGSGSRKAATFAVPAVAGYLVALVPSDASPQTEWMVAAGILLALSALVTAFFPWDRMPRFFRALPPIAYIGVIALMRMGTDGSTSAYILLLLLPLVWLALYGTRGQLLVGFAAGAAVLFLTGSLTGAGLQHSLLAVIVTPAVCLTIQRLVTRVRRQAAMLADLTNGDRLTGAITRRAWETTLDRELVRAGRTDEPLTIGFIDFDGFHKFNERFGADAGDDVLRRSVAAWRRELRAGDLLGRLDGDGFGVALPACTAEQAHEVVERLRVATTDLQTCSIGLAQWKKGESTKHFIDRALAALSAAKQQGRDRTVVAGRPASVEPAPAEVESSDDVLDSPTLLEQAAAHSRSLIAELHAVAKASASREKGPHHGTPVEETLAATDSETSSETPGAAPAAASGADEKPVEPENDDGPGAADDDVDPEDGSGEDMLAVVSKADGALVTVEDDLDGLLTVRGAKEIHKLLRDLSSTR